MYNQPYFIPGYYSNAFAPGMMRGAMAAPSMMRGAMSAPMWGAQGASRGLGLMGRLGSGISAIRSLNWGDSLIIRQKHWELLIKRFP